MVINNAVYYQGLFLSYRNDDSRNAHRGYNIEAYDSTQSKGGAIMLQPTLEQAKELAQEYAVIPVRRQIYADIRTPIEVLRILKKQSHHVYLLESVENQEKWGRYTYLGFHPQMEVTCMNGIMTVRDAQGKVVKEQRVKHPDRFLEQFVEEHKAPVLEGFPTFAGGLVGYFSFDYIKYSEPTLNLDAEDQECFKDVDLMYFDKVIAYDNVTQKISIICNAQADDIEAAYVQAEKDIEDIIRLIREGEPAEIEPAKLTSSYRSLFDKENYCSMVERAREYIFEGDIFQVVLSNRLEADMEGSLFDTYRVLRTLNPSPYMFYLCSDDMEVAGASPETLVKVENGVVHTFPLAGTRPRGATQEEDIRLEKELLADEKECAEHNMLVDLGRNDIGKISRFGSVEVEKYMSIERYSHVMHIGSTIKGQLADDQTALSAVNSILPAGTLSGAPKIRACEIINELENNKRGIYGGAIGYIDLTGNLDVCIAIRIAFKKNGKVFVRSGAGIVADSVPEKEYQECLNKAKAVLNAIELSQNIDKEESE